MNAYQVRTRRKPLEVASLGVKSNDREIPILVDEAKPQSSWLIGTCEFSGAVVSSTDDGSQAVAATASGTAAIAFTGDSFVGILSPGGDEPTIWWRWPIGSLAVVGSGSIGIVRKRPASISIRAEDNEIVCQVISRLYFASGSHKSGQEAAFLRSLR